MGLQAIHDHRTKHPLILETKLKQKYLLYRVALGHVSAHTNVEGYETADALANNVTAKPQIDNQLPPTYIKGILKTKILTD